MHVACLHWLLLPLFARTEHDAALVVVALQACVLMQGTLTTLSVRTVALGPSEGPVGLGRGKIFCRRRDIGGVGGSGPASCLFFHVFIIDMLIIRL